MQKMLLEYRKSKEGLIEMLKELEKREQKVKASTLEEKHEILKTIEDDRKIINSMYRNINDVIKWIETGINPYFHQGVDAKHSYDTSYFDTMELIPDINEQIQERDELVITDEQKRLLRMFFNKLTQREKDCVILHIAQGYSLSVTGELLGGIKKTTVSTHINRAREKMKDVVRM